MHISTGELLSENLIRVVYAIFDKNDDKKVICVFLFSRSLFQYFLKLSHKEFIGVMSDRLSRQNKVGVLDFNGKLKNFKLKGIWNKEFPEHSYPQYLNLISERRSKNSPVAKLYRACDGTYKINWF